jgi:hypothetical protein
MNFTMPTASMQCNRGGSRSAALNDNAPIGGRETMMLHLSLFALILV